MNCEGMKEHPMSKPDDRRQCWQTPPDFWGVIHAEFNFMVDAAANKSNALCGVWYGPGSAWAEDALADNFQWSHNAAGNIYCNPGFANLSPWCKRAYETVNNFGSAVALTCSFAIMVLCHPSTKWWAFCVQHAYEIRLLAPRPQFIAAPGIKQSSNSHENALVIFRRVPRNWPGAMIWTWQWKKGGTSDEQT